MAGLAAFGTTYTDLILNAMWRGSVGTPPSTLYFSLGQSGSTTVPVEISGVTRTAVKPTRGWMNGGDSIAYPYESSLTTEVGRYVQAPIDIYCTGLGASTYLNPTLMIFDAASGGNLLFVCEPLTNTVAQVINGDIVRIGAETFSYVVASNVCTFAAPTSGTTMHKLLDRDTPTGINQRGIYNFAMWMDWLFRGYDSINTYFPVGTYPNIYLNFADYSSGLEITDIPRKAVSRATGTWTAPAAGAASTLERKISNVSTITFAAATGNVNYAVDTRLLLEFRMSNTPQAFDDSFYHIAFDTGLVVNIGDTVRFTANQLEVVLN